MHAFGSCTGGFVKKRDVSRLVYRCEQALKLFQRWPKWHLVCLQLKIARCNCSRKVIGTNQWNLHLSPLHFSLALRLSSPVVDHNSKWMKLILTVKMDHRTTTIIVRIPTQQKGSDSTTTSWTADLADLTNLSAQHSNSTKCRSDNVI